MNTTKISISVVLIPCIERNPLEKRQISWDLNDDDDPTTSSFRNCICSLLHDRDYLETPLLRPRSCRNNNDNVAGLYAYYNNMKGSTNNIRATRLAMSCGLLSKRFRGNVVLIRSFGYGSFQDLDINEIYGACELSPDLRIIIQQQQMEREEKEEEEEALTIIPPPKWLVDAAQQNYHDGAAMAKVVSAMTNDIDVDDTSSEDEDSDNDTSEEDIEKDDETGATNSKKPDIKKNEFVANSPLCLHCRGPTSSLCIDCEGAYFCSTRDDDHRSLSSCRDFGGWSHMCQCPTWRIYTEHRNYLSTFDFLGDWHLDLMSREYQLQQGPYEEFLRNKLGISCSSSSWWRTELGGGWSGGQGDSSSEVDATIRLSYADGFAPITEIPPERRVQKVVDDDATSKTNKTKPPLLTNDVGLLSLGSWEDYYTLRGIPSTSPIALLSTFPLTVYYAIERFGSVPITVSRMLNRPLRVHIVGVEKELNFLDLFKEIGFLLPEDIQVELVFIVRPDMLPTKCRTDPLGGDDSSSGGGGGGGKFSLKIEMTTNLTVGVISGTYGTTATKRKNTSTSSSSIDPNFDCGTGGPDMVIALNAGLFAYESWRSVVTYLYDHKHVVGVFTDYNEYSGMNCACIGGGKSRESLRMNPFRQPRAMPVYSMNLPQFSNGFMYVFNEQELDE